MHSQKRPPLLIRLIALKKGIYALLLLAIAAVSAFSWRNYDLVIDWANQSVLEAEYDVTRFMLEKLAQVDVLTLQLIARIASVYGTLLGIAAIGLWIGKAWADPLFITLVGLLIPVEIYEIIHAASLLKVAIFGVNVLIFGVLLLHWLRSRAAAAKVGESAS